MTDIQQQPSYTQLNMYNIGIIIVIIFTIVGWLVPLGIKIGYGRLKNSLFKLQIQPKLAWFLFEVPNLIWALYFIIYCNNQISLGYSLFIIHYINRDIVYPLRMKTTNSVPLQIVLSAGLFTFGNGYIQGISNTNNISNQLNFIHIIIRYIGVLVFITGMAINIKCDNILQNTKQKSVSKSSTNVNSNQKYVLINQFLFKYVSNPNYFGQIIQWFGYFMVCQNFQSFLFFFSTLNVLVAAAIPRNKWNKKNIEGYPQSRKAVIPYVI